MSNNDAWLRFADLKRMKLVTNHVTLKRWIEQEGFPPGLMLGPNTRGWREFDVEAWLASRPTRNACRRGIARKIREKADAIARFAVMECE